LAAWADLLDAINVYPWPTAIGPEPGRQTVAAASGRRKFTTGWSAGARRRAGQLRQHRLAVLLGVLRAGRSVRAGTGTSEANARAWKAVSRPKPGTMLSVFDALEETLDKQDFAGDEESAASDCRPPGRSRPRNKATAAEAWPGGGWTRAPWACTFFLKDSSARWPAGPILPAGHGRLRGSLKIASSFREEAESGFLHVDFVV
jgi:hypothetical protein